MLHIPAAIKDADNGDSASFLVNKLIHKIVPDRNDTHPHGCPWLPIDQAVLLREMVKPSNFITDSANSICGSLWSEEFIFNVGVNKTQIIQGFR